MAASIVADEPLAPRLPRGSAGFTLIEVLVAMVILAVGLLAVEAMAIGAARQIASANRTTEYTLLASEELEAALAAVRPQNGVAQPEDYVADSGARVQVLPERAPVPGGTMWTVQVIVTPPAGVTNVQPVTLTGRVFQ